MSQRSWVRAPSRAMIFFLFFFFVLPRLGGGGRGREQGINGCITPKINNFFRGSIVVSIPACHAGDPGSIPGSGVFFVFFCVWLLLFAEVDSTKSRANLNRIVIWWYSVVVSISGCDPLDPGSNPGTAIYFFCRQCV